jgi:2-hydroxychromene-2-carboxylate isomerase
MRIEKRASDFEIAVKWRPFLLGPIFRNQGMNDSPFNLNPAKGRYMWRDLERICEAEKLAFQRPSQFPRNGLLAARVACRFQHAPWLPSFVRAVFRANFEEDLDISSAEIVSRCLPQSGDDPDVVLKDAQLPESKAQLRSQTEEAIQLGIFGAPSFFVNDELFWGNDRLEAALSWAKHLNT